jgi:hypothetical protein
MEQVRKHGFYKVREVEIMKRNTVVGSLGAAALVILLVLTMTACRRMDQTRAREVIMAYNNGVIEAFKKGDAGVLKEVAAEGQARRMANLIDARRQKGLALESRMEDMEVVSVQKSHGGVAVRTRERWCYCDRETGTGQLIGRPSEDRYEKVYFLKRRGGRWVVEKVELTAPPKLGEKKGPWEEGSPAKPENPAEGS